MTPPDDDPTVIEVLPFDEAMAKIRRMRKPSVFIHVGTFAPFSVQNPSLAYTQGTNGFGCLKVSKVELLRFLLDAFPEHWRPRIKLSVSHSKRCLFVGSSPR